MSERRTDGDLLAAWCDGDAAAGGELIDRKHGSIVRFFRNKVAVISDESDLVQQTFAGLVEGRTRIRDANQIDAFLFSIARNVMRTYIRKRSKRARENADYGELCVGDLDAASATSIAGLQRDVRRLAECLRLIPLEAQIVLELRFFEGATARTIAELTQIPRGSVERRVQQGMARLRELLRPQNASAGEANPGPTDEEFARWTSDIRRALPG